MLEGSPWPTIALSFTAATVVISIFQICMHLRNYTEPSFQRFIIRIIFLVPSYSVASVLAYLYRDESIYYETPRDCYEAWVIYNFMSLCMAYIGGPGAVVVKCEGKVIEPSWMLMTCCMKPIPVDGFFLRKCKQGTLQFVIMKPILATLTLALFIFGKYQVGNWAFDDGYPYITFVYNVCYAVALFWLLLLYVGTEELLKPYKPLLKFACFKAVIFLTFWQSLMISFMAPHLKITPDNAEALQNYIIVAEMFLASVGMLFAFPWSEYQIGGFARGWSWEAFMHAVSIMDVLSDILHMFNPSYGTYVLYHDGGPEKNVKMKKYRGGSKDRTQEEFSGATSATTQMPRRGRRRIKVDDDETDGNDEGAKWYGGEEKSNVLLRMLDRTREMGQNTGQQLVAWIPGITEEERNQAELLDSDSDAAYDEENVRDNQIDDDMLMDNDDEAHGKHPDHNSSQMTVIVQKPDESSLSRVEAAFGLALADNSVARVEAAFAEAFAEAQTATVVTAAPAVAALTARAAAGHVPSPAAPESPSADPADPADPAATESLFPQAPHVTVVPILAPPSARPTRSLGSPLHSVSSPSPATPPEVGVSSSMEALPLQGDAFNKTHSDAAEDVLKQPSARSLASEPEKSSNGVTQSKCTSADKGSREVDEEVDEAIRCGHYSEDTEVHDHHVEDARNHSTQSDPEAPTSKECFVAVQNGGQKAVE